MGPGDKILVRGLFGTSNEATGPKIGENQKIVTEHFPCLLHTLYVKKYTYDKRQAAVAALNCLTFQDLFEFGTDLDNCTSPV